MLKDLVHKNRSYRKFNPERSVSRAELLELVDLARHSASSKNKQPLKYLLVNDKKDTDFVFEQLSWAWYLKDWKGPAEEERPSAYILVFLDTQINDNAFIDVGIASQTILLAAVDKELGGCIVRTINRHEMKKHFKYSDTLDLVQVIAIGEPVQKSVVVEVGESGSIEYFEDESGSHFVPKRPLSEIVL